MADVDLSQGDLFCLGMRQRPLNRQKIHVEQLALSIFLPK